MKNINFEKEMRRDKRIFEINQHKGYWSYPNAPQPQPKHINDLDKINFDVIYKKHANNIIQITPLVIGYKVIYNNQVHIINEINQLKDIVNVK